MQVARWVLVAEDNDDDFELVRRVASKFDPLLKVKRGRDGLEALHILEQASNPPFLVVLDLKMARMSGHGALVAIRKDLTMRFVPIVILSSSEAPEDISRSFELGCSAYLRKPVDFNRFNQAVLAMIMFWSSTETVDISERRAFE